MPNLVAWLLLGLAVYRLGATLGARVHGLAAAALLLTVPLVVWHVPSQHIVHLAAFFLAGLYLGADYARTRSAVSLALALAATGVLLGVKTRPSRTQRACTAYTLGSALLVRPANAGPGGRPRPPRRRRRCW